MHELKPFLNDPNISQAVIVADIMRDDFPTLSVEQDLTQALQGFAKFDGERIPVINNDQDRTLLGFISKTDLLLTLSAK